MRFKAIITFFLVGIVVSAIGMHQTRMARQASRVVFEAAHRHNWFWADGWAGLFLHTANQPEETGIETDVTRLIRPFEASKGMTDCFTSLQELGEGQDEEKLVQDFVRLFEISETRAWQVIWVAKYHSAFLPDLKAMMENTSRGSQYSQDVIDLLHHEDWHSRAEEFRQAYDQMRYEEDLYSQGSYRISEKADRYYFFFLTSMLCFIGLFFFGFMWRYHIMARARLTKAQSYTTNIINSMPSAIIGVDLEGLVTHWNRKAQQLTAVSSSEAIGQQLGTVFPRLTDDMACVNQAVQAKAAHFQSRRPYTEDGNTRYEDLTVFPLMTESAVIRLDDVTDKVHMEEVMLQREKMVSVGRLAGGVAHDLNNLLSPIIGYGELLVNEFKPDDERRESMGQILRAGSRARDLVQQLLAFSRKQALKYRPVDLNTVVADYQKLLRHSIREDIEIEIVTTPDPCAVMADVGQIEQVIMNLTVNAQDAMPEGGSLTLEVSVQEIEPGADVEQPPIDEPGRCVVLTVSDTGFGMDEETRTNLFEPFYSTKGDLGTGLGLATVYGIVKQHGGDIRFRSEPGQGTTFTVYLPLSDEPCVEEEVIESVVPEVDGSETILLVEDDDLVRKLSHAILKRCGYTVLLAESGPEALNVLDSCAQDVDLLLTDVIMPGRNGRELFTEASSRYPGLKVLYMSGYSDDVIADRGVIDEGTEFLQKPFTARDLVAKVRQVFGARTPTRP